MSSKSHHKNAKEGHGLNEEQISELKEAFSLFDKDGDGNVTPQELGNMMRALGFDPSASELEAILLEANTSNSGAIDFPEFLYYMGRMRRKIDENDICREAWKVFDPEETGWITSRELMRVLSLVGEKLGEAEAMEMIKRVDNDADGKISYDDFVELMTNS